MNLENLERGLWEAADYLRAQSAYNHVLAIENEAKPWR